MLYNGTFYWHFVVLLFRYLEVQSRDIGIVKTIFFITFSKYAQETEGLMVEYVLFILNKLDCVAEEGRGNILPLAFIEQVEAFLTGD